ncbi:MAG: aminotransferase DegT [Peptococcaceae bacterium BRH_c4a]|nr:MAG: aminotransferase DegT [Peptococcaceae bacterium BRH_c4a]
MIPVCEPLINNNELNNVMDCVKSNWVSSMGKYIEVFEEGFSHYCGCKYGISTTSGTTALHLALAVLNIGPGDEVIVPTFTMAATVFAILYTGAKPVFVDSEPDTWNINPFKIEEKITNKTKVILPVHIYGHPCDMNLINSLAKKYNLFVIEDAAEAHGAEYFGRKAGSLSDIGCFSFYANKIITTGEGGMIVTNNEEFARKARLLKNLAFLPEKRFVHLDIGYNYRMTNIQAAIGVAQLEKIDYLVEARRRNAKMYINLLSEQPGITLPIELENVKNVYWMFGILLTDRSGTTRNSLMSELRKRGIETRTFFYPIHSQPAIKDMGYTPNESFPVADSLAERGLYLPSGSGLTAEQIAYVCDTVKEINYLYE